MEWEDENDVKSTNEQQSLRDLYLHFQPVFQQFCTFRNSKSHLNSSTQHLARRPDQAAEDEEAQVSL